MKKLFVISLALSVCTTALFNTAGAHADIANGMAATQVYGQTSSGVPSFTQGAADNGGSTSASGMDQPHSIALDPYNHRLFVVDFGNNRVLVYNLSDDNKQVSTDASYVLGQPNFTANSSGGGTTGMNGPIAVTYDPTRELLYVSDESNYRVLVFDVNSITNGQPAIHVLGQPDFDTYNIATDINTTNDPTGLAIDTTRQLLYVSEWAGRRIGVFDVNSITNGENHIAVLGQASDTAAVPNTNTATTLDRPSGVAIDAVHQRLFVTDFYGGRVVIFDVNTITTGQAAVNVLGAATLDGEGSVSFSSKPVYDPTTNRLFVVRAYANSVQVYDTTDIVNNEDAVYILGQPDFAHGDPATTAEGMDLPSDVAIDPSNGGVFISEVNNNRVDYFPGASIPDPTFDGDQDGVLPIVENDAPNGGDANADGTPDAEQRNVTSFVSSVTGKYVTIESSNDCRVINPSVNKESTSNQDIAFDYAQGFVNFSLTNCASGATVTLYFYDVTNAAFTLRKFTSVSNSYFSVPGAALTATTIGGHSVVKTIYSLTDNGQLDTNTNIGTIDDPVGLGTIVVGAPQTGEGGTAQ